MEILRRIHRSTVRDVTAHAPLRRVRAMIALTMTLALAVPPASALAYRSGSDAVGGVPLSKGEVARSAAPDVDAKAGILVTEGGRTLWSRAGSTRRPMASTTKMMTALLVLEKGGLDKRVKISSRAGRTPYGIGLCAGDRTTVRRLLELTLVASSNDGAYALGEYHSGSMRAFVRKMNARAKELGLDDTHFANPHGLDAPGHYSTPADLAKLARVAMKHAEFRRIVQKGSVVVPGARSRTLKATDKLLGTFRGMRGVKTGYTSDAGYSFVGSAKRGDVTLYSVVLGAKSANGRFSDTRRLLSWGFKHVEVKTIGKAGKKVGSVRVKGSDERVPLRLTRSVRKGVFTLDGRIRREASVTSAAVAPVIAGQTLGEVRYMQGKRLLARVPVVAGKSVASVGTTVGAIPVSDYIDRTVPLRTGPASIAEDEFSPDRPLKRTVDIERLVSAPVAKGQQVGRITYTQKGRVVAEVPVVAAASVQPPGFLAGLAISLQRGWRELFGGRTVAAASLSGVAVQAN